MCCYKTLKRAGPLFVAYFLHGCRKPTCYCDYVAFFHTKIEIIIGNWQKTAILSYFMLFFLDVALQSEHIHYKKCLWDRTLATH